MKRTPMPSRTSPLPRRKRLSPRNEARRRREFERCFHSEARVRFVQSLPCWVCHQPGPSDNAHVVHDGSEGMGRKGGYLTIAPLCRRDHESRDEGFLASEGWDSYFQEAAEATENIWQRHLTASGGTVE